MYTTADGKQTAKEEMQAEEQNRSATEQLAKVRYELEQQKRSLKECQMERQKAVSVLEEEMGQLRQQKDRLALQNRQLQEFKNQVLVEVDEDVFLTLAENLKAEIVKNQKLESQVQVYRDSLKYTHEKYSRLKLALLDKAIKKASKEKAERDRKEAAETKKEIEEEIENERMKAEQAEWEKKHPQPESAKNTSEEMSPEAAAMVEEALEEFDKEPEPESSSPISTPEVSEEQIEARPLPVKVRKAQKKED